MKYKKLLDKKRSCPFCHNKDERLIEYQSAFLTYALAPLSNHHILVVPKRHITSFLKLSAEESAEIQSLLIRGVKILHKLGYKDCSILLRDGKKSGKSIPHLHYHIIPNVNISDLKNGHINREVLSSSKIKTISEDIIKTSKKI